MRYSQKLNSYLRNALTSANLRIPGVFGTRIDEPNYHGWVGITRKLSKKAVRGRPCGRVIRFSRPKDASRMDRNPPHWAKSCAACPVLTAPACAY